MFPQSEREALEACVAAVRALAGPEGLAQLRAIEHLYSAALHCVPWGQKRWLTGDRRLASISNDLGAVVDLVRHGRLPVKATAAVLLEVFEQLRTVLDLPYEENQYDDVGVEVDLLRAKLRALEARKSKPAKPPRLPDWTEALSRTTTLRDYERYRLGENLRQRRPLWILRMPLYDQPVEARMDQIRAAVEVITTFQRDVPNRLGEHLFCLIAADDAHAQLGPLLEPGADLSAPEAVVLPDRRADELAWLRSCWAPVVSDHEALARLHETLAARDSPVVEPWREVGRVAIVLADLPELEVEARNRVHQNTVMDLAVAPSGLAASVDFSGRWSAWAQKDLREQFCGDFGRETRAISLSDDGARIAALVNLGASATYSYDAFIVELREGKPRHCPGDRVERIRWDPRGDFLVLGSALGYSIHTAAGELIFADATPKGLGATCFVRVPPRGQLFCIRSNVLGGVELGTDRALSCIDLAPFDLTGHAHWRPAGLDVRETGDLVALGPGNNSVFVLELATGRPLLHLVIEGVQIVDMKLAFDASGRYLLMSAMHIMGQQVTHLIYDGRRGAIVGKLTTEKGHFAHHARVVMSSDRSRVFAADGNAIMVARLPD
jgi:hypothetical protein